MTRIETPEKKEPKGDVGFWLFALAVCAYGIAMHGSLSFRNTVYSAISSSSDLRSATEPESHTDDGGIGSYVVKFLLPPRRLSAQYRDALEGMNEDRSAGLAYDHVYDFRSDGTVVRRGKLGVRFLGTTVVDTNDSGRYTIGEDIVWVHLQGVQKTIRFKIDGSDLINERDERLKKL